ncbi:hypothetical protein A7J05_00235 [Streptomyces alfalfae]|uniref:Uncharacterized protein n=1 Tax=Streptomyces alfalfae TaxID=1642299 RepID=A0ABN4VBW7_9ACTN|nr:hypothetical protein A7J05_00235 [Streptomyces alfalfae]
MSAGDEAFEFLRDAFGGDPRVVQDGDAVGELVGFFQVLGGEEDGDAAGDHMVWRLRGGGGGAGGGFVEEDDAGVADEGHGDVQAAFPAA